MVGVSAMSLALVAPFFSAWRYLGGIAIAVSGFAVTGAVLVALYFGFSLFRELGSRIPDSGVVRLCRRWQGALRVFGAAVVLAEVLFVASGFAAGAPTLSSGMWLLTAAVSAVGGLGLLAVGVGLCCVLRRLRVSPRG